VPFDAGAALGDWAVESAMREDPQIEKRVAAHRSLRQRVQAAYSAELSEPVPPRLAAAVKAAVAPPKVVNLREARAAIDRHAPRARAPRAQWRTAGTIAASLIAGVGLGFFMWGRTQPLARIADGARIARGRLAAALSNQLAADQRRDSTVQIGLSYLGKSGDYCRTFELSGALSPSGLACRHGGEWQIQVLAQGPGPSGSAGYRTAGSALPATILRSVEEQIAGEPLDHAGEEAARQRGWLAAPP